MAITVNFDGTTLFEGLSGEAGDWAGTNGISTEVFQQGTSSEGWIVGKNLDELSIYDYYTANGSVAADMSASDTHLYIHMRCDIAPFIDYVWIGISSTSLGNTNYEDWQVVDNTVAVEWYGEWKTFIVDINATADRSNGTLTLSDVRSIRINVDNSNSGNIRSIENTYLDVGRFGTGITAYETTATAFDFADIEAESNNSTNKFGVIESIGGVNFVRGRINIGDSAGTNYANFTSADESVVFLAPSVSGEQISTGLYQLNFVGNATNPTVVTFGTKVGTGDTMTGRNGTSFVGETTAVECSASTDANVAMDLYGCTFRQLGGLITFDDLDASDDIASTSFDGCDQVDTGSAVVRNSNVLNTESISTSGALLWDDGQTDIKNSLFVNNLVGIEIPTLTADITLTGMSFAGNTNDIRYEGASDYDANIVDSDTPSIQNAGAGTLTAVANPVTLAVHVQDISTGSAIVGARVYVLAATTGPLPFEDTVTITRVTTTATVSHTAHGLSSNQWVKIEGAGEEEYNGAKQVTVTGANTYTYTVSGTPTTPATGTIDATAIIIFGTTNATGDISDTRALSSDQDFTGHVRHQSNPYYKASPLSGTIDSTTGLPITVGLIPDE